MQHPGTSDVMYEEWVAWRKVCTELTLCSAAIDINEEPRLYAALILWGERLSALRQTQDPDDCAEALDRAIQNAAT